MNILQTIARQALNYCEDSSDHVRMTIHDRVYPLESRTPTAEPKVVPAPFRKLPEELAKKLPYAQVPRTAGSKDALYSAFHQSCEALQTMYREVGEFMGAIFRCNIEVRTDWMQNRRKHELMQRKAKEWEAHMPKFDFQPPDVIRLELDAKPEFIIRVEIENALQTACEQLVLTTLDALDLMVEMEQVGINVWKTDTSCRFHFFRHVVIEETKDVRQLTDQSSRIANDAGGNVVRETKTTRRTERDVQHTHRHARHVHEVVAAKNNAFPAKNVAKPQRVEELLGVFPQWLQPLGRIVTGTEVHRLIIEQDLRSENITEAEEKVDVQRQVLYRPDPAVVLGYYVLTGWGEEELTQK